MMHRPEDVSDVCAAEKISNQTPPMAVCVTGICGMRKKEKFYAFNTDSVSVAIVGNAKLPENQKKKENFQMLATTILFASERRSDMRVSFNINPVFSSYSLFIVGINSFMSIYKFIIRC